MRVLTKQETKEVGGGMPLLLIAAALLLSGCGAKERVENANETARQREKDAGV